MKKEVNSVAISGKGGSGKTTTAQMLGDTLGWRVYGAGKIFRNWVFQNNLDSIGAKHGQDYVHDSIDNKMAKIMNDGNSVVEGRVAGIIASINKIPGVFSVLLLCEAQERYRRILARDPDKHATTIEDVARETNTREAQNRRVFMERYDGEDYLDKRKYNLALDNTELDENETVMVILWVAGLGELVSLEMKRIDEAIVYREVN